MPLYEYKCQACGQTFEARQSFSDEPLTQHKGGCEGSPVERLLSAPALQFKGSGWYITDYAKGSSGSPAKTDGEKPAADKTADTGPTDSKKTESKTEASSKPAAASTPAKAE